MGTYQVNNLEFGINEAGKKLASKGPYALVSGVRKNSQSWWLGLFLRPGLECKAEDKVLKFPLCMSLLLTIGHGIWHPRNGH